MPVERFQINAASTNRGTGCYSYNCHSMQCDPYIFDTLMRDLVAHSRSSSAFLVYLQIYRHTHGAGRESAAMSHKALTEWTGISKRSVQNALGHLIERRLIRRRKARPTAVPVYTALTPWLRKGASF